MGDVKDQEEITEITNVTQHKMMSQKVWKFENCWLIGIAVQSQEVKVKKILDLFKLE